MVFKYYSRMSFRGALVFSLLYVVRGQSLAFPARVRRIPEKVDVSDVTFTTSVPDSDRHSGVQRVIIPVTAYRGEPNRYHGFPAGYPKGPKVVKIGRHHLQTGSKIFIPSLYRTAYPSRAQQPRKIASRPVYYLIGAKAPARNVNQKQERVNEDYSREAASSEEDKSEDADSNASTSEGGRGGDRVEFQMYGMNGPNSYKFGYDTGKGDNRHFRFEERDSEGRVRGHYGYMDDDGKMRIIKYEADPETGFRSGPVQDHSSEENRTDPQRRS